MPAREGSVLIAAAGGLAVLLTALGFLLGGGWWATAVLGVAVLAAVVSLLRDPHRTAPPPDAHDLLLAPADGKVIETVAEEEPLYLRGPSQGVSIAPSPFDVSVTRSPVTGIVEYERSVPRAAPAARPARASGRGGRREVGVRHTSGTRVLFTQVAGAATRQMSHDAPVGSGLAAGERCGVATFRARVDVAVPPHVHLDVTPGQRTVAGETVLGRIPGPPKAALAGGPEARVGVES